MKPLRWKKDRNVAHLEPLVRKAARHGAELAVAPETSLDGMALKDVLAHSERAPRMVDLADPMGGPVVKRFRALARELKMCLAFGLTERDVRQLLNVRDLNTFQFFIRL